MEFKKVLLLEAGFPIDIPEEMLRYIKYNNIEYDFVDIREMFWKENRDKSFDFFKNLPDETTLLTNHTFVDFILLEIFILMLHDIKDKTYNIILQNPSLCDNLIRYINSYESDITPNTEEFNDSPKLRDEFKKDMNKKFFEVLSHHNLYWENTYYGLKLLKSLDDIVDGCWE